MAAVVFLLPVYLFDHELIAPEGKPITAPALGRLLVLGYELLVWGTCLRLLRGYSPLLGWLSLPLSSHRTKLGRLSPSSSAGPTTPTAGAMSSHFSVSSLFYACAGSGSAAGAAWSRGWCLAAIAAIIVLDVRGYSFTAAGWPWAGRKPPWRSPWPRRSTARSRRRSAATLAVGTHQSFLGHGSDLGDGACEPRLRSRGPIAGSIADPPGSAADLGG